MTSAPHARASRAFLVASSHAQSTAGAASAAPSSAPLAKDRGHLWSTLTPGSSATTKDALSELKATNRRASASNAQASFPQGALGSVASDGATPAAPSSRHSTSAP